MVQGISSHYSRLDVLLNNAGTYEKRYRLTDDRVEMTFAVNYPGPFLLTSLLLPLLKARASSRIVTVASTAHEDVSQIDWESLPAMRRYDREACALAKFADICFTYTLARKLDGTGVSANCLHPGVIGTKILHPAFPGMQGTAPEEGAKTPVYLASSPRIEGISGKYFEGTKPVRYSVLTRDRTVQERLWNLARDLTGAG